MKNFFLVWLATSFILSCKTTLIAQSTANYTFSTATSGSLSQDLNGNIIDMSSGTTQLVVPDVDNAASNITNIGFSFFMYGNYFSQFSASSNGLIQLGATAVGTATYTASGGSLTSPRISAFAGDLRTGAGGKVHFKIIGAAPNRCLVVEFQNMSLTYVLSPGSNDGTYQVRLYENNGIIEFVYGSMFRNASTTSAAALQIGFSVGTTLNTTASVTTSTQTVSYGATFNNNSYTSSSTITDLSSTADGSRRTYVFTPPVPAASATSLTFSGTNTTATTLNWTAATPTTNALKYAIFNSTDNVNFNYVGLVALGTNTINATSLTPGTTYYWKVVSISEGAEFSPALTGTETTLPAATYYWVGATGGNWGTAGNWNTAADGTGTTRTTPLTSDVLIIDGAGTTPGGAVIVNVDAAYTIGRLLITSNTTCSLQASTATTRVVTISGGIGDDFIVENGSILNLTNATQMVGIIYQTGSIGNTGNISGTINFGGNASNNLTTTGGTNTLVTVTSTGIVNLNLNSNANLVGSTATLFFDNGSQCNSTGATTGAPPVPLATWATNSTLTISGITTSTTTATNNAQSFGNFIYNCPAATATMSFWGATTSAVIKGNLTIQNTNTGKFRALTSGTLTVNGNIIVNGGTFEVASTTGTLNILGNVSLTGGTFDVAFASSPTLRVAGNFVQTGGTLTQTIATGLLEFNGTTQQTFTPTTVLGTALLAVRVNNGNGVALTNAVTLNRLTISNGSLTGLGAITYTNGSSLTYNSTTGAQTITDTEFSSTSSPVSLTINNTSSSKIVTMPFSRTLQGSTGVLALTSGVLDNLGYTLTLNNTTLGAITGASATNYLKGAIERPLPASLVSGSTYTFPVGKSGYNPFELVNPITNAGGSVLVKAEVFDANCGGTPGNLMESISNTRYWAASITNGSANFTSSLIKLNDAPNGTDGIGASATVNGTYDLVGGTAITSTSTSLTTTAPEATSIPGFYVMGNKASATITNINMTPNGNRCTNVARDISATITAGGGAVTGVVLNYSVNGTAQTPITMTNTSGNDWAGTIPTVTPANATVTWSITATDANNLTKTATGISYSDEPNTGVVATATVSNNNICAGSSIDLAINATKSINATIGTATTLTSATTQPTAFCNRWSGYRSQTVYTATELQAAGLSAGNILSMAYNITTPGDATTNANFTVKIGTTALSALTTTFESTTGFTTVFPAQTYTHTSSGIQTINFSTPFVWNGTSNIIIEVSHNGANATNNSITYYTATTNNTVVTATSTSATTGTTSTQRLNLILGQLLTYPINNLTWSDGTNTVGTTPNLTLTPLQSATYFATGFVNGCTVTSNNVSVTVNPVPTAPTATNSSQCGAGIPTANVASTSGYTTPKYKWYSASTGESPIQTSYSQTYLSSVLSSTSFYVSEFDTISGCESSPRTQVDVNVTNPALITVSPGATANICLGASITLDATSSTTASYAYTWTANNYTASGMTSSQVGASQNITPTQAGTYTYTVTGVNGICTDVKTVVLTVNSLPTITTSTATPVSVCSGSDINLAATSFNVLPGTTSVGTGATTGTDYAAIFYHLYGGNKTQHLVTAAELSATGLSAGNITSLAIDIATGGGTYAGLGISVAHTSNTNMSGGFDNTATFVPVYSAASYTTTTGVNNYVLSTPFNWDGTSNIVIQFCWSNNNGGGTSNYAKIDNTSFVSTAYYRADNQTPAAICGSTSITGTYSKRPKFIFGGQVATNVTSSLNWSWTPGSLATASGTTSITNNTSSNLSQQFTVTATNPTTGCQNTALTNAVTVYPEVIAPVASNSLQCGLQVPTASVTDPNSITSPVFNWYATSTGGTALQSGTSNTYNTAISSTTTFYVSVVNPITNCESDRTPVTVSVNTPDAISVSSTQTAICLGGSFDLTVNNTETTPTLNYIYTWTGANGSGVSSISGSTITVTPTIAGTYTYSVSAVDGICTNTANISVTTNVLPTITTSTATPASVCSGSDINLAATSFNVLPGTASVGTGATTGTDYAAIFYHLYGGNKTQHLITAAELSATGLSAGNITNLAIDIAAGGGTYAGLGISLAHTSNTNMSGGFDNTATFVPVYSAASYTTTTGVNNYVLSTPFNWDGTSNIVIQFCWSNNNGGGTSNYAKIDNTSYVSTAYYRADNQTPAAICGSTSITGTYSKRPKFIFGGQVATNVTSSLNWSWTPGSLATASGTTSITNNTSSNLSQQFTVTATNPTTGCQNTALSNVVTVYPEVAAPLASNSLQCGLQVPTASVTDPNAYINPTFNWYAASTGGTALQSSTANTYNTAISATTTFYVSIVNPTTNCESLRTPVTVNVSIPDAISLSSTQAAICLGQSFDLSATNSAASPTQNYAYTWSGANGSGVTNSTGTIISVTPTIPGVYTYSVNAVDGICANTANINVTVNALPNITSSTASPTNVCSGSNINLAATSFNVQAGNASVGAGANIGNDYAAIFYHFYGGNKTQHLITASELSSAGLSAGNITSLAIEIASGGGSYAGLGISIAHTLNTNMATGFDNTTTFAPVYSTASFTTATGVNNYSFSTPFNWDGTSNIIIQFCWSNNNGGGTSNYAKIDNTSYVSTAYYRADNQTPATICGSTTNTGTYSKRPKFTFGGQVATDVSTSLTWNWMPGNINDLTGIYNITNNSASPITQIFTVTVTNPTSGCIASDTAGVTIHPIPQAPTANNTSVCGVQNATCSLTGSNTPGNTYLWYTSTTGGSALSGQTGTSLVDYPISSTTNFYVSEFNGFCESPRTNVSVTFVTAPAVSLSSNSVTICSGSTSNAVSLLLGSSDYDVYTWSPSTGVVGNASTGWTFTNTTNTTYTLTASQSSGLLCENSTSIIVNVIDLPTAISINPSAPSICPGAMQSLTAIGGDFTQTILTESFESPIGWTTVNNSTGGTPANAEWTLRPSGYIYSSVTYSSNDASQFYMANSDAQGSGGTTNVTLTSPSFSTVDYSSVSLSYYTYYRQDLASFVEYSLDGTSWNTIQTLSSTIGTASNFVQQIVNLPAQALNQAVVYIRFQYNGTYGWYWSIDNVVISGNKNNITWTPTTGLYLDASASQVYNGESTSTVYASPSSTSTYTATSTNSFGCTSAQNITVTVLPIFDGGTISSTNQTICSGSQPSDITYSVIPSGGINNLEYQWYMQMGAQNCPSGAFNQGSWTAIGQPTTSTTLTASLIGNLVQTTTFALRAKDNGVNACFDNWAGECHVINVNTLPSSTIATNNATCFGSSNGGATVTANGNGGFTYSWNDLSQQTTETASNLIAGIYVVTITDANGCQSADTATITQPAQLAVTIAQNSPICLGSDAVFTLNGAANSTVNYTINGGTTASIVLSGTGAGTITVTNATTSQLLTLSSIENGTCVETLNNTSSISVVNFTASASENGNALITSSVGSGYQWINCQDNTTLVGETAQTFTATDNGSYAVIVTNSNGCIDTSNCVIIDYLKLSQVENNLLVVYPNPSTGVFYVNSDKELELTITDETGRIIKTVAINKNNSVVDITKEAPGIYYFKSETEDNFGIVKVVVLH